MLNTNNTVKCSMVLIRHDKIHQLLKLIEELAELSRAASVVIREDTLTENFKEEMADVYVMCQQAQMLFGITDEEINKMAEMKLDRTLYGKNRTWMVKVAFLRYEENKVEYNRTYKIKADNREEAERIVFNGLSMLEFANYKIVEVKGE